MLELFLHAHGQGAGFPGLGAGSRISGRGHGARQGIPGRTPSLGKIYSDNCQVPEEAAMATDPAYLSPARVQGYRPVPTAPGQAFGRAPGQAFGRAPSDGAQPSAGSGLRVLRFKDWQSPVTPVHVPQKSSQILRISCPIWPSVVDGGHFLGDVTQDRSNQFPTWEVKSLFRKVKVKLQGDVFASSTRVESGSTVHMHTPGWYPTRCHHLQPTHRRHPRTGQCPSVTVFCSLQGAAVQRFHRPRAPYSDLAMGDGHHKGPQD